MERKADNKLFDTMALVKLNQFNWYIYLDLSVPSMSLGGQPG